MQVEALPEISPAASWPENGGKNFEHPAPICQQVAHIPGDERGLFTGQFRCKDWQGAKVTWLGVREYDENDVEANTFLATIFQRLGDLVSSDQAVERALHNQELSPAQRAEIRALMGRNAKNQWEQSWAKLNGTEATQQAALTSPYLERSLDLYRAGFAEDREV